MTTTMLLPFAIGAGLGFLGGIGAMLVTCMRVVALYKQEQRAANHYADLLRQHATLDDAAKILNTIQPQATVP
jgi:hypothetical protein